MFVTFWRPTSAGLPSFRPMPTLWNCRSVSRKPTWQFVHFAFANAAKPRLAASLTAFSSPFCQRPKSVSLLLIVRKDTDFDRWQKGDEKAVSDAAKRG